jgi:hypothetical protein
MAYHDHPTHNRPTLRVSLDRLNKSVAALTASLEDLYHALDEVEQTDAQVLTFDFGTTSSTPEPEPAPARHLTSRDEFPKARSPWSADDDLLLTVGLRMGLSREHIAERLGRNGHGVKARINRLRAEGRL